MPRIYSPEKRQDIKNQLLVTGLALLKQYGMKKMSIEQITQKVGIAQGTFYNFFRSKEMLVLELATSYQEKQNQKLLEIVQTKGYLDRSDLYQIYSNMFLIHEDNVFRFLTREDIQLLLTRLPSDCIRNLPDLKNELTKNLEFVKGKKECCDLDCILNWIQVMNLTVENTDFLITSGLEKLIHQMLESMLNEIF